MFTQKDFVRRFPKGLGTPILRHTAKGDDGIVNFFEGGPMDLSPDHEKTLQDIYTQLAISPMEEATSEDIMERSRNDVEGIIFSKDKTYRYFVWLTVSRRYTRGGGSDGSEPADLSIKAPFLIWFGSDYSILSSDVAGYFFNNEERVHAQLPLYIDGHQYVFLGPDPESRFHHYCILGKDFLNTYFKHFEADYENLIVKLKRRRNPINCEPSFPERRLEILDEELEEYMIEEDDGEDEGVELGMGEAEAEAGAGADTTPAAEADVDTEMETGTRVDTENVNSNIDPVLLDLARSVEPDDDSVRRPRIIKRSRKENEEDSKVDDAAGPVSLNTSVSGGSGVSAS